MLKLQQYIHKIEEGPGFRYLRVVLLVVVLLALVTGYNFRCYRNLDTAEAMDALQVARNLADGQGYSTKFIRPVSIYLLKQRAEQKNGLIPARDADYARLNGPHPDLANPPVYPAVLAAVMKVLPMKYQIDPNKPFWTKDQRFFRFQPEFLISLVNQTLFLVVILLTFLMTRRLFDPTVAWVVALLLLGSELLWRFSVSGLSTMLLMVFMLGLAWTLMLLEAEVREPQRGFKFLLSLAVSAGILLGLGSLTRYSFGVLVVPALVFIAAFGGPRRVVLSMATLLVFLALLAPWIYRNYAISGMPFGIATYAPLEGTYWFPEFRLGRSLIALEPAIKSALAQPESILRPILLKFLGNLREIIQSDVIRLGGSWATPFFFVGLMLAFRNPGLRRLRYFLLICLGMLILAQAMGRTHLSEQVREVNSENLLVLVLPLVLMFGVGLFFVLLDQIKFIAPVFRYVVIGVFAFLMWLPLLSALMPPRTNPVAYPPYHPVIIQQTAGFMKEDELMMSDMPWAVAWYGNRQCLWLTLNPQRDFFAIYDDMKPIRGLYLTPITMDGRFLSQMLVEQSWGNFALITYLQKATPVGFPLRTSPAGYLPQQLFLTDWERWRLPGATPASPPP